MSNTIKDRLIAALQKVPKANTIVVKLHTDDKPLTDIFIWQEIKRHAEAQLEFAWWKVQDQCVVPKDDALRTYNKGKHIVAQSTTFSCLVTVTNERALFQPDVFMTEISKRYKIKLTKLQSLAALCYADSKTPLSKEIIEVP